MNDMLKKISEGEFFVIAGPCAIENSETPREIVKRLLNICHDLNVPFIFKGSYRKANRSALNSFTGIGDQKALEILKSISDEFDVPVTTDVHTNEEAILAANYVDVIQIPAFSTDIRRILIDPLFEYFLLAGRSPIELNPILDS